MILYLTCVWPGAADQSDVTPRQQAEQIARYAETRVPGGEDPHLAPGLHGGRGDGAVGARVGGRAGADGGDVRPDGGGCAVRPGITIRH